LVLVVPRHPAASDAAAPEPRVSWALVLDHLGEGRTRLIARGRISRWEANFTIPGEPIFIERVYGLLAKLPRPLLLPVAGFGHHLMETRMLRGVKRRAEHAWAEDRAKVVRPPTTGSTVSNRAMGADQRVDVGDRGESVVGAARLDRGGVARSGGG
jgi:hypothetical protein